MAKRKSKDDAILEAVQNLLIVQLAQSGVDNHTIRKIVGIDLKRVTSVATLLKKKGKRS